MVDVSDFALRAARTRLGPRADLVQWVTTDARELRLPRKVDLWHDRAVFHFLIAAADQEAYLASLSHALRPGGHVVLATFGPQGPENCSGLPVERYDSAKLARRLGADFDLVRSLEKLHTTPSGTAQQFTYCVFKRRA